MYKNELTHYGILGQKWGVRRYQNEDGTLTAAGKLRYGTVENLEAGRTRRQAKSVSDIVKKGSIEDLKKNQNRLTKDELNQAIDRIKMTQSLDQLKNSQLDIGQKRADTILKTATSAVGIYNLGAVAVNAITGKDKLPVLKELSYDEKKKKYELERKMKEDAKKDYFEETVLRSKDKSFFENEENLKRFTAEEIGKAGSKIKAMNTLNEALGKSGNNKANKDSGSGNSNNSDSSKESKKTQKESPTYSEPSQEKKKVEVPTYSEPSRTDNRRDKRDNSPKVSSFTKTEYTTPSDMKESSKLVDKLADSMTDSGKGWARKKFGV